MRWIPLLALALGCTNRWEGGGTAVGNPARTSIQPAFGVLQGTVSGARFDALLCPGGPVRSDPVDVDLTATDGPRIPGGALCSLTLDHQGVDGDLSAAAGREALWFDAPLVIDGGDFVLELGEPGEAKIEGRAGLFAELVVDGTLDPVERGQGAVAFGPERLQIDPAPAAALLMTGPEGRFVLRTDPSFPDYPSLDSSGAEFVAAAFGDGVWIAVGGDGYVGTSAISTDGGLSWTTEVHDQPFDGIAFYGGRFAATHITGTIDIWDGSWRESAAPQLGYKGITSSDLGFLALAGTDVALSADGDSWQSVALPGVVGYGAQAAAWGVGRFVAVGDLGYRVTSVDGLTWTDATSGGNVLRSVVWDGFEFLAVGASESWTSADGTTWTPGPVKDLHAVLLYGGEPYAMDTGGWVYGAPEAGVFPPVFEPPDDGVFYGFATSQPY